MTCNDTETPIKTRWVTCNDTVLPLVCVHHHHFSSLFIFQTTRHHSTVHSNMNQDLPTKRDRSTSPPPPMSTFNSPRQRRIFLTLIMRNTQLVPPNLRIDRVVPIMCQLFKCFGLYEEDGAGNGFYCDYHLNFEEDDFHF